MNRLWFLNFNDAPLILDNYFQFRSISGQTFSEILIIFGEGLATEPAVLQFGRFLVSDSPRHCLGCKYLSVNLRISEKI